MYKIIEYRIKIMNINSIKILIDTRANFFMMESLFIKIRKPYLFLKKFNLPINFEKKF
jgi:hypothetical protein